MNGRSVTPVWASRQGKHAADQILRLGTEKQAGGSGRSAPEIAGFGAEVGVEFSDREIRPGIAVQDSRDISLL